MSQQTRLQVSPLPKPSITLAPSGLLQRKCSCGKSATLTGQCSECERKKFVSERHSTDEENTSEAPVVHEVLRSPIPTIQPKLKIGQPNDRYEQEADRIADQVMRMPAPSVQRQITPEDEEEKLVQRKTISSPTSLNSGFSSTEAPPIVHNVLNSPGQPLDSETRTFMESRFRHDFSQVRVHTDMNAERSAQAVNARAFTVGQNIVFGSGQYQPRSLEGQRLLAHELTHVMQQNDGSSTITSNRIGGSNIIQRARWSSCPSGRRLDPRVGYLATAAELMAIGRYKVQFPSSVVVTNKELRIGQTLTNLPEREQEIFDQIKEGFHRDKSPQKRTKVSPPDDVTERAESVDSTLRAGLDEIQQPLEPDVLDLTLLKVYDITTIKERPEKVRKIKNIYVGRLISLTGLQNWEAGKSLAPFRPSSLPVIPSKSTYICFGPTDLSKYPGVITYEAIDTSKPDKKKDKGKKKDRKAPSGGKAKTPRKGSSSRLLRGGGGRSTGFAGRIWSAAGALGTVVQALEYYSQYKEIKAEVERLSKAYEALWAEYEAIRGSLRPPATTQDAPIVATPTPALTKPDEPKKTATDIKKLVQVYSISKGRLTTKETRISEKELDVSYYPLKFISLTPVDKRIAHILLSQFNCQEVLKRGRSLLGGIHKTYTFDGYVRRSDYEKLRTLLGTQVQMIRLYCGLSNLPKDPSNTDMPDGDRVTVRLNWFGETGSRGIIATCENSGAQRGWSCSHEGDFESLRRITEDENAETLPDYVFIMDLNRVVDGQLSAWEYNRTSWIDNPDHPAPEPAVEQEGSLPGGTCQPSRYPSDSVLVYVLSYYAGGCQ